MEYASMLQRVATHASWVIRNDVMVDIQPDFIDLREDNAVMPVVPHSVLPVVPAVHVHAVHVPVAATQ